MENIEWVGYLASILTTVSFVPQAYKTWKSRSAKDISLTMFLMMTVGVFLWLTYGVLRHDNPLIIGNVITFLLSGVILYYKILEMKR